MKKYCLYPMALAFVLVPLSFGQAEGPPVAQPVVSEGEFALQLVSALNLGKAASEEEAIRILKEAGITPKSGWSADYPLTPALVGEIRDSIVYAVAAGKVRMTRDDALKSFREVTARNGLSVFPAAGEQAEGRAPAPPDLEGYYSRYGPPPITYYPPPPPYGDLYSYTSFPFYSYGSYFPGFYQLGGLGLGLGLVGGGFFDGFFFDNRFAPENRKFFGKKFDRGFAGAGFGGFNRFPRAWDFNTLHPGFRARAAFGRSFGPSPFRRFNFAQRGLPGPGDTRIFRSTGFPGFNRGFTGRGFGFNRSFGAFRGGHFRGTTAFGRSGGMIGGRIGGGRR